jgi:hypothetical protein
VFSLGAIRIEGFEHGYPTFPLRPIEVLRVGLARYEARFTEGKAITQVEFWTTKKGRINVNTSPELPEWAHLKTTEHSTLESLSAQEVDVHIEHMDRGHYFVGLTRMKVCWRLSLVTCGYIKMQVRAP